MPPADHGDEQEATLKAGTEPDQAAETARRQAEQRRVEAGRRSQDGRQDHPGAQAGAESADQDPDQGDPARRGGEADHRPGDRAAADRGDLEHPAVKGRRPDQVGETEHGEGQPEALQRPGMGEQAGRGGEVGAPGRAIHDGQPVEQERERHATARQRAESDLAGRLGGLLERHQPDQADHQETEPHHQHPHLPLDGDHGPARGGAEHQGVEGGEARAETGGGGAAGQDRDQAGRAEEYDTEHPYPVGDHRPGIGGQAEAAGVLEPVQGDDAGDAGPDQGDGAEPPVERGRQSGAQPADQGGHRGEREQQQRRQHGREHRGSVGVGHQLVPGKRM